MWWRSSAAGRRSQVLGSEISHVYSVTRNADLCDILNCLPAQLTSQLATQLQEMLALLKETGILVVDLEVSPLLT